MRAEPIRRKPTLLQSVTTLLIRKIFIDTASTNIRLFIQKNNLVTRNQLYIKSLSIIVLIHYILRVNIILSFDENVANIKNFFLYFSEKVIFHENS